MIIPKEFQTKKSEQAISSIVEWLELDVSKTLVLEGTTGCGKTLISGMIIQGVRERSSESHVSIYISIRHLPSQTRVKMEKFDKSIKCIDKDSTGILDNVIRRDELFLINWESINKKGVNKFMSENELGYNLETVIKNTKNDGHKIVLYIDEYHHTANSERSLYIINKIIKPDVTVKMSATPDQEPSNDRVTIDPDDVIASGLIKKGIRSNPQIEDHKKNEDMFYVSQGVEKIRRIKFLLRKTGEHNVNPLLLIQLPHANTEREKKIQGELEKHLEKIGITVANRKLAFKLDKDTRNYSDAVIDSNNEVEVLVFKDSISVGWDCPRAWVLTQLRSIGSISFSIQLYGRIIRMVSCKHYAEDELNYGYIYHNSEQILVGDKFSEGYVHLDYSYRNDDIYDKIDLPCEFIQKNRASLKLSHSPYSLYYLEEAKKYKLNEKIVLKEGDITCRIGHDGEIIYIDRLDGAVEETIIEKIVDDPLQIEDCYDSFLRSISKKYTNFKKSKQILTTMHREYFENNFHDFPRSGSNSASRIKKVILSNHENIEHFKYVHEKAQNRYNDSIPSASRPIQHNEFNVPEAIYFKHGSKHKLIEAKKSIMQPFYILEESDIEIDFAHWLNDNDNDKIKWFFKNGTKGTEIKYFSIVYEYNGKLCLFYPDWIVMYNDGTIGIYETKFKDSASGEKVEAKAGVLYNYIDKNNKNMPLHGGIVTKSNSGLLYINNQENYKYKDNSSSDLDNGGWTIFDKNTSLVTA